jgi:hypothetical protein
MSAKAVHQLINIIDMEIVMRNLTSTELQSVYGGTGNNGGGSGKSRTATREKCKTNHGNNGTKTRSNSCAKGGSR